ncbi:ShlB/FhaC/HecB family hemolysin secretion/activation protein [Marinobacter panjinensis]|uniref:ShlB/FhaC/HecB family hemolysin secretion/activation protein n=1 Tax=Marinobacter panjinensis TaxID=2576384 RepID=A0A4U6R0V2_9GAMM|nr:ShlB/FhaC/HecB family hemolysin secretion/activation protein [Marinobacter panjinensis]MCR8915782.1 ShlB/FhaC/HecB family hemolysin secretion/activation protein [Marinobacter panjinensis]TKV67237.1 ShlB/FhaC/HecB family hemolysin secretion/activation protein [Marinobacter panjinensis]
MKLSLLIALLWCVVSQPLYGQENGAWLRNGWQPYSGNFAGSADAFKEEREHWLRSRLKFSGKTALNSDGINGAVGVAADRLVGKSDAIGFDYRDARSYKNDTDSSGASFRYRFPAGANRLRIEAGRSRYEHAVSNGDRRFNASGESRVMGLGVSRPLFSRFGMAFGGIAQHRGRDSVSFRENSLVSESRYQLSTLGLEARGGHELWGGIVANTNMLALSGREFQATDYPMHDDQTEEGDFYKVAMSASVEHELFQWNWRVKGRYQFANEDLPASEYITVAGPSMLTGFNGQSLSVVRGGWLRLDTASPAWPMPFVDGVLSSVNFAVLQGWVPYSVAQANRHGTASAGQVSLKMQGRAFTANVSVGRMIRTSSTAMTMPDHPDVRFSLSMGI